jgi:hypothetical protein
VTKARVLALFAVTLIGCSLVTGVEFDRARLVGSSDPNTPEPAADGGACEPEPNAVTCAGRCGEVLDNCGAPRQCPSDCGPASACVAGRCECAAEGAWCRNRCGDARNNCNQPVSCGECDGGIPCANNSCGCVPEPVATTCGSKGCGTATNNCGQLVSCGVSGACSDPAAACMADGTCCVDDGSACALRCGSVEVTNNCGKTVGCPSTCAGANVCIGTTCCVPDALEVTCAGVECGRVTNNCGQLVTCPNTCAAPDICRGNACVCFKFCSF